MYHSGRGHSVREYKIRLILILEFKRGLYYPTDWYIPGMYSTSKYMVISTRFFSRFFPAIAEMYLVEAWR